MRHNAPLQVMLTPEQKEELDALAVTSRIPRAVLVREGIAFMVAARRRGKSPEAYLSELEARLDNHAWKLRQFAEKVGSDG
jgi:hypothetical protein